MDKSDDLFSIEINEGRHADLPRAFWIQFPHDDLDFFLAERLLELRSHIPQILLIDKSLGVTIDLAEHLLNVLTGVAFVGLLEDHTEELLEINIATFIPVVDSHGLIDVVSLGVVPPVLAHGLQQVPGGQHPVLIRVEYVEDILPDFDFTLIDVVGHVLPRLEVVVRLAGTAETRVVHPRALHLNLTTSIIRVFRPNRQRLGANKFKLLLE